MKAKKARLYFLGLTLLLAIALLMHLMSIMVSSIIFAGGLLFFGILSQGFRRQ